MRIKNKSTKQVARKYVLVGEVEAKYHVWPTIRPRDGNGKKSNANIHAISFNTVEEAAAHLVANPKDQIRMQPGHALINKHVIIETRSKEPEPHNM